MTAKPATNLPVDTDSRPVGALAVPETAGTLLTRINEEEALWDDLDDLDMVPDRESTGVPFVKTDGNIDGGLYMDGQLVDHVDCIIASRSVSRSKFEKTWEEDKNAHPICWSSDGLTPDDNVPEKQSDKCASCSWSFEKMGNTKLTCKKNLELLAYFPGDGELDIMRFRMSGISVAPGNTYWNSFSARIPKRHPIGFITRVTMVPKETANGRKLAAHFERVEPLQRDAVEAVIADARRRKAMWQQMIAEDVTSAGAQADDGNGAPGPFDDEPPFVEEAPKVPVDFAKYANSETGEIIQPEQAADLFGGASVGSEEPF